MYQLLSLEIVHHQGHSRCAHRVIPCLLFGQDEEVQTQRCDDEVILHNAEDVPGDLVRGIGVSVCGAQGLRVHIVPETWCSSSREICDHILSSFVGKECMQVPVVASRVEMQGRLRIVLGSLVQSTYSVRLARLNFYVGQRRDSEKSVVADR
jgi:hypothetical protein